MPSISGARIISEKRHKGTGLRSQVFKQSSTDAKTCSVTGCCHAVLMVGCFTLYDRGRRSCTGPPTSALSAGRHIQSMQ